MIKYFNIILFIILFGLFFFIVGCSSKKNVVKQKEEIKIEKLNSLFVDSMSVNSFVKKVNVDSVLKISSIIEMTFDSMSRPTKAVVKRDYDIIWGIYQKEKNISSDVLKTTKKDSVVTLKSYQKEERKENKGSKWKTNAFLFSLFLLFLIIFFIIFKRKN